MNEKELNELRNAVTDKEELLYKGCIYGEFGTRKTTTALRCSETKAVLLHADRGWQVIHNHPDEFPADRVIPVTYQGLSQVKAIIEAIKEGEPPFDGTDLIVLDTLSQMQEIYIDFLLANADYGGKFRDSLVPKPGVKGFEKTEIPGMPDYQLARNKLRPIVNALVHAPVNVIFLAHVREPGPMEVAKGKLEKRPNITEALYKVVARDATFIGYATKNNAKDEYKIDFEPKNTQSAKSQIPSLTDKKINASDLPEHLNKWRNR
jgi:hypothetical protein